MKILILLLSFYYSHTVFCQQNTVVGKWKTMEVTTDNFRIDRNDSIILPEKSKNRTKIGLQDQKAMIRSDYANNVFVFTAANEFYFYKNENGRTLTFDGTYTLDAQGKISLHVKNSGRQDVQINAEYYFKNGAFYLKMYAGRNHPIDYVLEKFID